MKTRENTDWTTGICPTLFRTGLIIAAGLYLGLSAGFAASRLDELQWWQHNPQPTGQALFTVTAGPEGFIAAGDSGTILRSKHGAYWEPVESGCISELSHSFHTGTEYTVFGAHSLLTSTDGIQWEDRKPALPFLDGRVVKDVDRLGQSWAILCDDGVHYSPDGSEWTHIPIDHRRVPISVSIGEDRILVGLFRDGEVIVHLLGEGQDWLNSTIDLPGFTAASLSRGEGLYLARVDGRVLLSDDGLTWDSRPLVGEPWLNKLSFSSVGWLGTDSGGRILYSADSHNWEIRTSPALEEGAFDVAVSESGTWVGVGWAGMVATSMDGQTWIRRDTGPNLMLYGMARIGGYWVAGGEGGKIVTSVDSVHWTEKTVGQESDYFHIQPDGDSVYLWGGCNENGIPCLDSIYVTTDGQSWTQPDTLPSIFERLSGLPEPFSQVRSPITTIGRQLVAARVGTIGSGALFVSNDGTSWENTLLTGFSITSLAGDENLALAGDAYGTIHLSSDLVEWEPIEVNPGGSISSILCGDGFYLASSTGYGGGIFGSEDGRSWERLPITRAQLYGGSKVDGTFWFVGEGGTIIEIDGHQPAPLANLSVRAAQSQEAPSVIAGFVVEGTGPREVLVRAIGQGLQQYGVSEAGSSPLLSLYAGDRLLDQAGGWTRETNAQQIQAVSDRIGAFPLDPEGDDAAMLLTLEPGIYTAIAEGLDASGGQRMIEVYDAAEGTEGRSSLVNSSNRGRIESDQPMVGGLVVRGDRDRLVLVRAIGPGLNSFGVEGAAADPRIVLWRDDEIVAWNDNWGEGPDPLGVADAAIEAGAFELAMDSGDAGLVFQARPGNTTIHVLTADGSDGGEVLLEIYYLDR